MGRNQYLWILLLPIWIVSQGYLFLIFSSSPDSFILFSVISFIVYLVFILLFTTRYRHSPSWVEEYYSLIQSDSLQPNYEPLTEQDILTGWWIAQKRGLKGFLRRVPHIASFSSETERSILVEVESEAEYFQTSNTERSLPYSQASSLAFFSEKEPFPVNYPKTFVNYHQEFPLSGTLKKETCSTCEGLGKVSCSSCSGSGTVTCSRCSGWGYIERTEWDGDERKTVQDSCSCFSGRVSCSSCGGSGDITCSICQGEGSLGKFTGRLYEFNHWKNVHVFKERNNEIIGDSELKDLPNEDARLIEILEKDSFSGSEPDKIPKISKSTTTKLLNKKEEFQGIINKLENVLFYRHTFREFPEVKIVLSKDQKDHVLVGRGFKPFKEEHAKLGDYPISKLRLIALYIPYSVILTLAYILISL
ncbi:MAG: hypothetical protein JSW11_05350 [Candidatus Heimdallarchaeota archaeon]|nr:MAG: hypothetical protein JSW11_05350 [Candidatus Heimdallarchaeota archaeon]